MEAMVLWFLLLLFVFCLFGGFFGCFCFCFAQREFVCLPDFAVCIIKTIRMNLSGTIIPFHPHLLLKVGDEVCIMVLSEGTSR